MKRIITIFLTVCILISSAVTISALEIPYAEMETIDNNDNSKEIELQPLAADDECDEDEDGDGEPDDDDGAWGGLPSLPIGGGGTVGGGGSIGGSTSIGGWDGGFPGYDGTVAPGEEWIWKGDGAKGSREGSWTIPGTNYYLWGHLENNGDGHGPHWDYRDNNNNWYRIYPNGTRVLND